MSYELSFEIAPELYKQAVSAPPQGAPHRRKVVLRNILAAALGTGSLYGFSQAFFGDDALMPMIFGASLGGFIVLAVWRRQHIALINTHARYNDTAGMQKLRIGPDGIKSERPHIRSEIDWHFVHKIRDVEGATLIELPTARLIVPDVALPKGESKCTFIAQLETWRSEQVKFD